MFIDGSMAGPTRLTSNSNGLLVQTKTKQLASRGSPRAPVAKVQEWGRPMGTGHSRDPLHLSRTKQWRPLTPRWYKADLQGGYGSGNTLDGGTTNEPPLEKNQ